MSRFARPLSWVAAMAVGLAAFVLNTAYVIDPGLHDTKTDPRYWQDLHIATGLWRTGMFPAWVAVRGAPPISFSGADPQVKSRTLPHCRAASANPGCSSKR